MSESSSDNQSLDLNGLDFGPAWARKGAKGDNPAREYKEYKGERPDRGERGGKSADRRKPRQGGRPQSGQGGGGRDSRSRSNFKRNDNRDRKPRREFAVAAEGVKASIMPIEEGVDNLVKEITASGRTYSVFDLARVVLGARERFLIIFRGEEKAQPIEFLQSKHDGAVFLTKEECVNYAAGAEWLKEIYKSEVIEVDSPAGAFQNIAKCGMSGELLGPTNFHGYQDRIIELHRSKFSHLSLENYKRRIVTENGEEVVNEWKESMTKQTVYKLVSNEEQIFDNKTAMMLHFTNTNFEESFHKTQKAQVPSGITLNKLSPGLLTSLKECIQEQRRYPGDLSSFLCRQLSGRQLAVFKWQGKLHCGPSRPHKLPDDLNMADRPKAIYSWVSDHVGDGIDALWKDVCPADIDEKTKQEWHVDLRWLIKEGYVIFMNNGLLFPSSASKKPAVRAVKKEEVPEKEVKAEKVTDENLKDAKKTEPKSVKEPVAKEEVKVSSEEKPGDIAAE